MSIAPDTWRLRFADGREVELHFEQVGDQWVADDGTEESDPSSLVGGQGDTLEAAARNMLVYAVQYDGAVGLLAPGERVVHNPFVPRDALDATFSRIVAAWWPVLAPKVAELGAEAVVFVTDRALGPIPAKIPADGRDGCCLAVSFERAQELVRQCFAGTQEEHPAPGDLARPILARPIPAGRLRFVAAFQGGSRVVDIPRGLLGDPSPAGRVRR